VIRRFLITRPTYMGFAGSNDNLQCFRTIVPEYGYWLELEEDGKLFLVADEGSTRFRVKGTDDMAKPGWAKEVKVAEPSPPKPEQMDMPFVLED
jgi:hypothetical protein